MVIDTSKLPVQVGWRITNLCSSCNCKFCYSPKEELFDADADTSMSIANKLVEIGTKRVVLTGGEPLEHVDSIKIIKYLKDNNIKVNLSTNGVNLLEVFNNYSDYISVLAIPLEGIKQSDDFVRGIGHYEKIIAILKDAKTKNRNSANDFSIKIETVITDSTTTEDLEHIKKLCLDYKVKLWKIFEYNYYPNRGTMKEVLSISPQTSSWISNNKIPCMYVEHSVNRNRRHFIVNPNGDAIIPVMDEMGIFSDIPLGNILKDSQKCIKTWWRECNFEEFSSHHHRIYLDLYSEADDSKEGKILLEGAMSAGVTRIYNGTDDFSKFRIINSKSLASLVDYLRVAENKLIIITHGMTANIFELRLFLLEKFKENRNFEFTMILPKHNSLSTEALARAIKLGDPMRKFKNEVDNSTERINEIKKEIKDNLQEYYKSTSFVIKYSDQIIFGSTIVIDDKIIQTETKYLGVPESKHLIVELRVNENKDSYFQTQLNGVQMTIDNAQTSLEIELEDKEKKLIEDNENKKKLRWAKTTMFQIYSGIFAVFLIAIYFYLEFKKDTKFILPKNSIEMLQLIISIIWIIIPLFTSILTSLNYSNKARAIIKNYK